MVVGSPVSTISTMAEALELLHAQIASPEMQGLHAFLTAYHEDTNKALNDILEALESYSNRNAFLESVVQQTAASMRPSDLRRLIEEVRIFIGAAGGALKINDDWMTDVPEWLSYKTLPVTSGINLVGFPNTLIDRFEWGWCIFWGKPQGFDSSDERIANRLGDMLSPVVERIELRDKMAKAMLREHERKMTVRVWRTLLAETLPKFAGYELASLSEPAKDFGGDFFIASKNWLLLGDVSGKGMTAAFLTGMFLPTLRLAVLQDNVAEAIEYAMYNEFDKVGMFATLAAVELQPDGLVRYINLGHPPIIVKRHSGDIELLKASAPPMGTFPIEHYHLQELALQPGDQLCLYSDGVTEAQRSPSDEQMFAESGLVNVFSAHSQPTTFIQSLKDCLADWYIQDDLTLVALQYQGVSDFDASSN